MTAISWSVRGPGRISGRCCVLVREGAAWEDGHVELTQGITLDDAELAALCRRHGIRRLALFGSALHDELRPDSDIDLLVEFEPGSTPGLIGIAAIELELECLLDRRVDLRTPADLSRYFRDTVTAESRPLYDAAWGSHPPPASTGRRTQGDRLRRGS